MYFSVALVALGAVVIGLATIKTGAVILLLSSSPHLPRWLVLRGLMSVFVVAYLAACAILSVASGDPDDKRAARMVQGVVNMCQGLSIHAVAEGVETAEQLAFLKECGCEIVQGYYLARPMPFAQLEALLRSRA